MNKQILMVTLTVLGVLAAFVLGAVAMSALQFGGIFFAPGLVDEHEIQTHWEPTIYRDYAEYEETILESLLESVDLEKFDDSDELQMELVRLGDIAEAVVTMRMADDRPPPSSSAILMAPSAAFEDAGLEPEPE